MGKRVKRMTCWFVLCASALSLSTVHSTPEVTLDDLKKLEIICFVPSYLPKDFRLQRVDITYDESGPDEAKRSFPLYSIVYNNDPRSGATFSIESAREGIGDRNIMVEDDTEETEIQSPLGPIDLICRPKGKNGRKDEIRANWVEDSNMKAENTKKDIRISDAFMVSQRQVLRSRSSRKSSNRFIPSETRDLPHLRHRTPLRLRFIQKFSA